MSSYVFVGTWNNQMTQGEGIHVFRTGQDGVLQECFHLKGHFNTSLLALTADRKRLYAVEECKNRHGVEGAGGSVKAFAFNEDSGVLTAINEQPSMGAFPCYAAVAHDGSHVVCANFANQQDLVVKVRQNASGDYELYNRYDDATVTLFPTDEQGGLLAASDVQILHGKGSCDWNVQQSSHPHSVFLSPGGRFYYVCDMGADRIYCYEVDAQTHRLRPAAKPFTALRPADAPKYMAFHPTLPYAFVCCQYSSTVLSFHIAEDGTLTLIDREYAVCDRANDMDNTAKGIVIHPSGRFLYISNCLLRPGKQVFQGEETYEIFTVDPQTGRLTRTFSGVNAHTQSVRMIGVSPCGRFLYAVDPSCGLVMTYDVDVQTGMLLHARIAAKVPGAISIHLI